MQQHFIVLMDGDLIINLNYICSIDPTEDEATVDWRVSMVNSDSWDLSTEDAEKLKAALGL